MSAAHSLPTLLLVAWLLPLASFALIVLFGPRMGKAGVRAGHLATAAILASAVLSFVALFGCWLPAHPLADAGHGDEHHAAAAADGGSVVRGQDAAPEGEHAKPAPRAYSGDWYVLAQFGALQFSIGYYIDALTVAMFCMVTFIATCIHFYALGYMHDELHDVTDHEVHLANGQHLHRRGRFHRFFQYLSLFCFSMLGIVVSGNIAMTFVFWELVGICSYFLIGFYIERHSASTAANKAFIVNRVGDFGMIIGLMILFGTLGTFHFGTWQDSEGRERAGLFELVRPAENHHALQIPSGMVLAAAGEQVGQHVDDHRQGGTLEERQAGRLAALSQIGSELPEWREDWSSEQPTGRCAYWLLVVAGVGIFCGCVGKSAQFPLHVWLPDAMEGPTPVSALVHSATMVAAGVFLVGRFYPVFTPEVLLVIAVIGGITLFLAATIAITATDIKRVLAYSTVSQLGYMMLALGVGGWVAGMFHLITHAFFKSLLFMCSGSVIHACHTNEMPKMGGLRRKMPWTAYTMLAGCLAIAGAPLMSGFYSKDAIVAQAMAFRAANPLYGFLFYVAAAGAAITAFYMFRLWFMTFAGEPRDHHIYDHAHESPKVMYYPLVVLAVLAVGVGWSLGNLSVTNLLEQARPAGTQLASQGKLIEGLSYEDEHASHAFHGAATLVASGTALAGFLLALVFYGLRLVDADEARRQFAPLHSFLRNKWYFDELYEALLVRPAHFVARRVADLDKRVIDWAIDSSARLMRVFSLIDDLLDRYLVDGLVNWFAGWTWSVGLALRSVQTGRLRQYVMFIVVGTVGLFVLISFFWNFAAAGS
jgi:NADH-quinone oxidoreductase subunit L